MTELQMHELYWQDARRRMPFLRKWKVMTQNKADHTFWKIVRYYAQNIPLCEAMDQAHCEMLVLYRMVFNKDSKEWRTA